MGDWNYAGHSRTDSNCSFLKARLQNPPVPQRLQVNVQCWSSGAVRISGEPRAGGQNLAAWPPQPVSETIQLPVAIDPKSAHAKFTTGGQLYVRVNAHHGPPG